MTKQSKTPAKQTFFSELSDRGLSLERIAAALMASVLLSYVYQLLSNGAFYELGSYYNSISFVGFFVIMILALAVMVGATYLTRVKTIIPWALAVSSLAVSVLLAANYKDGGAFFCLGIGICDFIIALWLARGDKLALSAFSISRKAALIAAAVLFVGCTIFFGYFTSAKYLSYNNFTFDFGIFAQMYERMATTFSPSTTVERSHMMSHFGVHFSPIFYLFLPGYYIFRSPLYLFYVQAAGVASGVFAVWLIAGKLKLSGKLTLALELIYAFYPCLMNGTFYDFHENKFLTSIILFLFYFIISKNTLWEFIFAFLLLMVKEDAAIYLIVIALFVMINRKEFYRGFIMLGMAIIYFIIAQAIVASAGTEGVMIGRLSDYFVNGERGFGSVIKAVFFDFGFLLKQMFTAEKIPFLLWMFLPVCCAPFLTGTAALIIVSAILVISRLKGGKKRVVVITALFMCMVMSASLMVPKINNASSYLKSSAGTREQIEELLDSVPTDATVTAAHSLVPHLYKVEWLYTMPDYNAANRDKPVDTDYFVIDTRYSDLANEMKQVMANNYSLVQTAGFAELYKHN